MNNSLSQRFADYKSQAGGRVLLLFLLFLLALYEFYSMGITGYALVCIIPLVIAFIIFSFRHKMVVFWYIFIINYTIMGLTRYYPIPIPITVLTIMPQLFLLQIFNETCMLPISFNAWSMNFTFFSLLFILA